MQFATVYSILSVDTQIGVPPLRLYGYTYAIQRHTD